MAQPVEAVDSIHKSQQTDDLAESPGSQDGSMPRSAAACNNLGVCLGQSGRRTEAVTAFREALRLEPNFAQAHHNLGVALAQLGDSDRAVASFRQALRLRPDYPEAQYNLANTLGGMGRQAESVESYRQAIRCKPDYAEALCNLGLALCESGQPRELGDWATLGEAVIILRQAARLRPDYVEAHNNLGLALAALGRFDEAVASYEQGLRLMPGHAQTHANLGSAFKEQGRLDEAAACYEQALRLDPESASAHWNLSLTWLQMGDYERGWREYEWRWRRKGSTMRPFRQPLWDGSPLAGRTILLHSEQGLGDTIQFVRYAAVVQQRGGRVVLECPGLLLPLFARVPGVDQLVAEGTALPAFDVHAPLMSLPRLVGTTLATVPAEIPYLTADPRLVETWRRRLESIDGFKIGICWQGNPHHKWDRHRSIPLAQFASLAALPGVRLISIQKTHGTEQIAASRLPITNFSDDLDRSGAFTDTAAIIRNLDLVITTDTAIAHLAGALGAPVWLLLSSIVDWRWMLKREDTPWYPTMRLFRQPTLGDWDGVFERLTSELRQLLANQKPSGTVTVEISPGDLLDKLTILQIKSERITDAAKLAHVRTELAALARQRSCPASPELDRLTSDLETVNETLWQIEDDVRICERDGDFGQRFIELARSVYRHNDQRAALKRQINELLRARFAEQKQYAGILISPERQSTRLGKLGTAQVRGNDTA
jgi:tetratricopeptide (TPR) repeat protein